MAEQTQGEVTFGLKSIARPTPNWAKWAFRIFFYISSLTAFIILSDGDIPQALAIKITKYLTIANMAIHGLSKMFGIDVKDYDQPYFNKSSKH